MKDTAFLVVDLQNGFITEENELPPVPLSPNCFPNERECDRFPKTSIWDDGRSPK